MHICSATRLPSRLLCVPVVPLDAPSSVGRPAGMCPAWLHKAIHKGWALQDHPESPGHRRLVLDGHGVPGVPSVSEEGGWMVAGGRQTAGAGTPVSVPGSLDVHALLRPAGHFHAARAYSGEQRHAAVQEWMDSTKKVTRKLAGAAAGTAAWATNIGNEHGQVLMSVLTASEGARLLPMAAGIVQRYQDAGVEPPQVLYVNQDCCSSYGRPGAAAAMFAEWGELVVRLDIWHLMRRLASGVTTESHQLYRPFMQQLSSAIFEWQEEDAARLQDAKKRTLVAQGMSFPLDAGVWRHVSRKEMALHCRRRTRGAAESERLIDDLLKIFGRDETPRAFHCWTRTASRQSGQCRSATSAAFRTHRVWSCTPRRAG
ncbi:hypothetical protein AALO_G00036170 [Alosa alosa]|uniref:Transposase n=1 Tax=Alosa alosa TaxID=278164 RepID=A0AAV6H6D5_9TELE|nr:hypothetical protein AALO_G00036170 [Alosa alosa]